MSLRSEFMEHILANPSEDDSRQKVEIFDTTLRDGSQGENISFSVEDKLKITCLLDDLGVAYIEGGWPGSNPKDAEYFERVRGLQLQSAQVTAFGMTCRVNTLPQDDDSVRALVAAGSPAVAVVGKSSLLHVVEVLRTDGSENLRMIASTVAYLKSFGKEVIYDAEHFFDGYKLDRSYALESLKAAREAGADCVVLCDTNGGTMPWEIEEICATVVKNFPDTRIGIHTHNDSELAVANSLCAVRAGIRHVQGTINGYGERCGNANLCSVVADLELKLGFQCLSEGNLKKLTNLSRTVAEMANQAPPSSAAYVGRSAFAHKGGMHVAAMRRISASYQHVEPEAVGNLSRTLVSELSGRGNLLSKAEEYALALTHKEASRAAEDIKILENEGYSFEGAEASTALLLSRQQPGYAPPFRLVDFKLVVENDENLKFRARATVTVEVEGQERETVAEGVGPVEALDRALRLALVPLFPQLESFRLADYKVRILDSERSTNATTRVMIDSQNGTKRWTTVGASANIIEASYKALADSFEFGINGAKYASNHHNPPR